MRSDQFAAKLKAMLETIGEYLTDALGNELIAQGHQATGDLVKSIASEIGAFQNILFVEVQYNYYGRFLETGIPASRIPFGGASTGAKTSKYIQGLMNWIRVKGLERDTKKVKGFAFAIARTHKKYGYVSPNSRQFSSNGRVLRFQSEVLYQAIPDIQQIIKDTFSGGLELIINDLINQFKLSTT